MGIIGISLPIELHISMVYVEVLWLIVEPTQLSDERKVKDNRCNGLRMVEEKVMWR
ncbi:hypothetical protein Hdeb2414_s0832g00951831 [Helianthus debilis subsp. tardiflorus]